jgi:hypothetical protein
VADDLARLLGHQFEGAVLVGPQPRHQLGLGRAPERLAQHRVDGRVVGSARIADHARSLAP